MTTIAINSWFETRKKLTSAGAGFFVGLNNKRKESMEPIVFCKHCNEGVGLSEAKRDGWKKTVIKVKNPVLQGKIVSGKGVDKHILDEFIEQDEWEHEPKKVWDNETKSYILYPFCIAKQIKKGTHPKTIKV